MYIDISGDSVSSISKEGGRIYLNLTDVSYCKGCGNIKDNSEFKLCSTSSTGRQLKCKSCNLIKKADKILKKKVNRKAVVSNVMGNLSKILKDSK